MVDTVFDSGMTAPPGVDPLADAFILVIDDESDVREATAGLLQRWGCRVLVASGSTEAVAALNNCLRLPDAIVCDNCLRGNDTAVDAIAQLHRVMGAAVPAVVITGDTDLTHHHAIRAAGWHLLLKPVSAEALHSTLAQLLTVVSSDALATGA
jgi:CheY-like chemotaxis protein